MRLSVIILIAVLVVGGTVISLGFLNEPEIGEEGEAREELSAFENLEKYRDDLVRINEGNVRVLEDAKAADPDADADSPSGQEIAVLEQVIAQNVKEIGEISERLAEMMP